MESKRFFFVAQVVSGESGDVARTFLLKRLFDDKISWTSLPQIEVEMFFVPAEDHMYIQVLGKPCGPC